MEREARGGPGFLQKFQARAGWWSPDGKWFAAGGGKGAAIGAASGGALGAVTGAATTPPPPPPPPRY